MAERASMPTFVPRTVATFERAATAVARRVAAPVRMLATRALSFADRLVGTWANAGVSGGSVEGAARTTMRAAERGGGMPVPRPWYDVDADEDAIWPQQAARTAAAALARATADAATTTTTTAERGAAIARTAVTAAPEIVARAADATGADESRATAAVPANLRAAEALGLRAAPVATPMTNPVATVTAARAATPLGRALAHAAWVDAQLRAVAAPVESAPVQTALRGGAGYVFVAPADVERGGAGAHEAPRVAAERAAHAMTTMAATPAASAPTTRAPAASAPTTTASTANVAATIASTAGVTTTSAPATSAPATAGAAATSADRGAGAAMAAVAGWSAALPDPRLAAAMPTAIAQRVSDFVARLVGAQTARDVEPIAAAMAPTGGAAATGRPAAERTFVLLAPPAPAASWRPGAAGARVELEGARVDARLAEAWGEPTARAIATASATTSTARASGERVYVAPLDAAARATGPARLSQFVQQLVGVQAARATAPLPVQALIAAQAAAVDPTAPATAAATARAGTAAMAASVRAPARVPLAATMDRPTPAMAAASTDATGAGAMRTAAPRVSATVNAAATMAPGAIGRRAEQLGGVVGVRAASLSIDFVDPARLSLLSAAPPSMPTVTPAAETVARDTIMPAPQPLFVTPAPSLASPMLTAEEWSLVATFPSAATAMQLATTRQSAQWAPGTATARAAAAPARTLLAAIAERGLGRAADAGEPTARTNVVASAVRGGAPTDYVAPTAPAADTQARLPGGRMPRGSFTWPKLADYVPSRAEWTAPVAVALAEQTKQAAPGTPLWGALPALIAVSPSLAASGFGDAAARAVAASAASAASASPSGGAAPSSAGLRELVRGDASLASRDAGARGAATAPAAMAAATDVGDSAATDASTRRDAPAMTLMTAAATREARAAARMGLRDAGDGGARDDEAVLRGDGRAAMPLAPGVDGARGNVGVSNVRPAAAMPLMTAGPTARDGGARAAAGPTARALELARPFLRLVEGGIAGDAGTQRSSGAPRFFEQPQPVVAGAPSSDSASRIVEALRNQPAAASSDDRVSLADLTLIAIASATQQVAASAQGGGPTSAAAAPSSSTSAAPAGDAGHGGKSQNPAQEIEELARAAFDELRRLFAMARERSGEHG